MHAARKSYASAVKALLEEFNWNPWFLHTYWPENAERVQSIVELALKHPPDASGNPPAVVEVGCANGDIACLFSELGCRTSAIDAIEDARRDGMFASRDIAYTKGNLNDALPLTSFRDESMDVVVLGDYSNTS